MKKISNRLLFILKRIYLIFIFAIISLLILLFFRYWGEIQIKIFGQEYFEARGINGDMFGGINALFTGLAFAGLAYSIYFQLKTRGEDEKERRKQQFESTFFQLLKSHQEIISNLCETSNGNCITYNGRKFFRFMITEFQNNFKLKNYYTLKNRNKENDTDYFQLINDLYSDHYSCYNSELGSYYRTLYHIFKLIDERCHDDNQFYSHIVRAQLSDDQVEHLFYNCSHSIGAKFRPYLIKYKLLKHLPDKTILLEDIKNKYGSMKDIHEILNEVHGKMTPSRRSEPVND